MIRSMAHVVVYVKDHEEAKEFYIEKLGFEVKTDVTLDSFRWLTVGAPEQPDLEIALMELKPGGPIKEEHVPMFEKLLEEGGMGMYEDDLEEGHGMFEDEMEEGLYEQDMIPGEFPIEDDLAGMPDVDSLGLDQRVQDQSKLQPWAHNL